MQKKLRLQDILREGLCISLVTAHGRFLSCRGDGTTAVGDVLTAGPNERFVVRWTHDGFLTLRRARFSASTAKARGREGAPLPGKLLSISPPSYFFNGSIRAGGLTADRSSTFVAKIHTAKVSQHALRGCKHLPCRGGMSLETRHNPPTLLSVNSIGLVTCASLPDKRGINQTFRIVLRTLPRENNADLTFVDPSL